MSSGLEAGSIFLLETISVAGILISIMANSETSVLPDDLTGAPNDGFLLNWKHFSGYPESVMLDLGGTQREHGSKLLKNIIVKRILVFKW